MTEGSGKTREPATEGSAAEETASEAVSTLISANCQTSQLLASVLTTRCKAVENHHDTFGQKPVLVEWDLCVFWRLDMAGA